MPLKCDIITQERLVYSEEVDMVVVRGIDGEMGILPNHSPLITALDFGEVRVKRSGVEEGFAVGGGVLQVAHNRVIILADSAEHSDEIDVARADEARRRAEKMVAEGAPEDPAALAALEAAIKRANIRTKVGARRGYRKSSPFGGENTGN